MIISLRAGKLLSNSYKNIFFAEQQNSISRNSFDLTMRMHFSFFRMIRSVDSIFALK